MNAVYQCNWLEPSVSWVWGHPYILYIKWMTVMGLPPRSLWWAYSRHKWCPWRTEACVRRNYTRTNILPLCAADVVLAYTWEMDLITFSTCWDRWEAFRPRSTWFASCQLSPHLHNPPASRQPLMRREQHHFYSLSSPLPSLVYGDTWREGKFENCIAMCAFLCACAFTAAGTTPKRH